MSRGAEEDDWGVFHVAPSCKRRSCPRKIGDPDERTLGEERSKSFVGNVLGKQCCRIAVWKPDRISQDSNNCSVNEPWTRRWRRSEKIGRWMSINFKNENCRGKKNNSSEFKNQTIYIPIRRCKNNWEEGKNVVSKKIRSIDPRKRVLVISFPIFDQFSRNSSG